MSNTKDLSIDQEQTDFQDRVKSMVWHAFEPHRKWRTKEQSELLIDGLIKGEYGYEYMMSVLWDRELDAWAYYQAELSGWFEKQLKTFDKAYVVRNQADRRVMLRAIFEQDIPRL